MMIDQQKIDAAADALRRYEMAGRIGPTFREWAQLPSTTKNKWREKATVVLKAAGVL